ncbi:hypothetical protein LTR27_000047 [Elasticomyces elasticus]|nr:hypothetical protein LTR27_000047 [Elasticomyces elasticus]
MSNHWKSLPLDDKSVPHLLIKANLDSLGYTIQITDLSRIWGETLTKKQIKQRALNEDCSVDPSEGEDQYQILLKKIQQALDQQEGASLSLGPPKSDNGAKPGHDRLTLDLSAPLPSPLPALKWRIHFSYLPPTALETSLLRPLLQHAQVQQAQIQSLIHELGEKDRVISKITDRLETSGNDLTAVFPGVSNVKVSRKKSQREQLARHVRGLGDFDQVAWKAQQHDRVPEIVNLESVEVDGLLSDLPEASNSDEGENGEWWKSLRDGAGSKSLPDRGSQLRQHVESQRVEQAPANGHAPSDGDVTMTDDGDAPDEEFQRQATPPRAPAPKQGSVHGSLDRSASPIRPTATKAQQIVDDDSTEDEDDLDAPSRESAKPPPAAAAARQRTATPDAVASSPRKLGKIGGGRQRSSSPTKEPSLVRSSEPSVNPSRGKLGAIGGKSNASATSEPTPEPPKPRAKLGAIGGKPKAAASQSESTPETAALPQAKPHKLGMLGGKKSTTAATTLSAIRQTSETPSVTSTKEGTPARQSRAPEMRTVKEPTPPRETSQERADRKRIDLKRQLDESAANAAKGKKKRKF